MIRKNPTPQRRWRTLLLKGVLVAVVAVVLLPFLSDVALACGSNLDADQHLECLPMYRWTDVTRDIWTDNVLSRIFDNFNIFAQFGKLLFTLANIVIGIAGWGVQVALEGVSSGQSTFMNAVLSSANQGFRAMRPFAAWGIPVVIIFGLLSGILPRLAKFGANSKFFGALTKMLIPLGVLWGMVMMTGPAPDQAQSAEQQKDAAASGQGLFPVGSPAWFAQAGAEPVDALVNATVGQLISAAANTDPLSNVDAIGGGCSQYTAELHNRYREHTNADDNPEMTAIQAVSGVWEATYLRSWYIAQFGSVEAGTRSGCRLLEGLNQVSAGEQASLNSGPHDEQTFVLGSDPGNLKVYKVLSWEYCADPSNPGLMLREVVGEGPDSDVGGSRADDARRRGQEMADRAAGEDSSEELTEEEQEVQRYINNLVSTGRFTREQAEAQAEEIFGVDLSGGEGGETVASASLAQSECSRWVGGNINTTSGGLFGTGLGGSGERVDHQDLPGFLGGGQPEDYQAARSVAIETHANNPEAVDRIEKEYLAFNYLTGGVLGNTADSLVGGGSAFISALGMMLLVGLPALLGIASSFVLIWWLMILPITLTAMALPALQPMGRRMMSFTIFTVFAKGFFTLLLGINILFLTMASNIVEYLL